MYPQHYHARFSQSVTPTPQPVKTRYDTTERKNLREYLTRPATAVLGSPSTLQAGDGDDTTTHRDRGFFCRGARRTLCYIICYAVCYVTC